MNRWRNFRRGVLSVFTWGQSAMPRDVRPSGALTAETWAVIEAAIASDINEALRHCGVAPARLSPGRVPSPELLRQLLAEGLDLAKAFDSVEGIRARRLRRESRAAVSEGLWQTAGLVSAGAVLFVGLAMFVHLASTDRGILGIALWLALNGTLLWIGLGARGDGKELRGNSAQRALEV